MTFPIKKAPHLHGVTKQALFRRTVLHQAQAVKRTEKDIKTWRCFPGWMVWVHMSLQLLLSIEIEIEIEQSLSISSWWQNWIIDVQISRQFLFSLNMLQFNPDNWTKQWNSEIKSEIRVGDHEAGSSIHVLPLTGMGSM